MNPMNTGDWINAAQNIVQAVAIIVGGVWAYYKFIKGPTLKRRAAVAVTGTLITTRPPHVIRAKATLTNIGSPDNPAQDIPLRAKILRAYVLERGEVGERQPAWDEVAAAPVFQAHEWLDAHEQISDVVVIALPHDLQWPSLIAARVTCLVYGAKRRRLGLRQAGAVVWTDTCVIPFGETHSEADARPVE